MLFYIVIDIVATIYTLFALWLLSIGFVFSFDSPSATMGGSLVTLILFGVPLLSPVVFWISYSFHKVSKTELQDAWKMHIQRTVTIVLIVALITIYQFYIPSILHPYGY